MAEMFNISHMKNEACYRTLNSPHRAGLQGCGYGHGFVDVAGENGSNQTVVRVVGSFDHFFNRFELHNLLDWPKNLQK